MVTCDKNNDDDDFDAKSTDGDQRGHQDDANEEGEKEEFENIVYGQFPNSTDSDDEDVELIAEIKRESNGHSDLRPFNPNGCSYQCPQCPWLSYDNLETTLSHMRRRHGPHTLPSLMRLKQTRVTTRIKCRHCNEEVIHDRNELAAHMWAKHHLPLEAYKLL